MIHHDVVISVGDYISLVHSPLRRTGISLKNSDNNPWNLNLKTLKSGIFERQKHKILKGEKPKNHQNPLTCDLIQKS
jgi:hypothetical protein